MEISIELDGFYCPDCNDFHPTLMWHERYDDYATRETRFADWQKNKEERPALFRDAVFQESVAHLGVAEHDNPAPCIVCECQTHFADANTGGRICSAECKSAATSKIYRGK